MAFEILDLKLPHRLPLPSVGELVRGTIGQSNEAATTEKGKGTEVVVRDMKAWGYRDVGFEVLRESNVCGTIRHISSS